MPYPQIPCKHIIISLLRIVSNDVMYDYGGTCFNLMLSKCCTNMPLYQIIHQYTNNVAGPIHFDLVAFYIGIKNVCTLFLTFFMGLLFIYSDAGCDLARGMRGRWYLQGVGEVVVGSSNITSKGYCVEGNNEDHLFLFENR